MSNLLHIYAQESWHDEVFIVGDRQALTVLRDALNTALDGCTGRAQSFTADGEGYDVLAVLMEEGPNWKNLRLPYTDEAARDRREASLHPWDMFREEATKAMSNQDKPCDGCEDCKCGTNRKETLPMPDDIRPEEPSEPVLLTDEEGNQHQFTVVGLFEVNDKEYVALIPVHDDTEESEVVLMRVEQEDGQDVLVEIDDDEEWAAVEAAYDDFYDEEEAEEGDIQ